MKTKYWLIIVSIMMAIIVMQREFHHCPKPEPCPEIDSTSSVTIIPGDSIPHQAPKVEIGKPDSIVPQPIPKKIDSAAVAQAYYSKVYGYNVMVDDSTLYVGFKWMVEQNQLKWTIPNIANRKKTAIIHKTTIIESVKPDDPKLKVFVGMGTGGNLNQFDIAPAIALLTRKQHLYTLDYKVFNEEFWIHTYWKLNWKFGKKPKDFP